MTRLSEPQLAGSKNSIIWVNKEMNPVVSTQFLFFLCLLLSGACKAGGFVSRPTALCRADGAAKWVSRSAYWKNEINLSQWLSLGSCFTGNDWVIHYFLTPHLCNATVCGPTHRSHCVPPWCLHFFDVCFVFVAALHSFEFHVGKLCFCCVFFFFGDGSVVLVTMLTQCQQYFW